MGPRRTPRSIARRGLRSLRGKTIRWELTDGAGGKSVYHHTFHADGSIVYRGAEASGTGRRIRPNRSFYGRLSETIFAVSYLNPPYTLTAFLDASTGRVRGVVSSDTMWTQFSGTWTLA